MDDSMDAYAAEWCGRRWTPWVPLDNLTGHLPNGPGLYRVRARQVHGLVYVGQTGRDLRERVRALAGGVYRAADDPPWNDPHTAAPLLWAYRIEDALRFEVSVCEADLDEPARRCLEDYALYQHRLQYGGSTLTNHGRLHPLWTRPTNRSQGRPTTRRSGPVTYPSLAVARSAGSPAGSDWLGLQWSAFQSLRECSASDEAGVYRITEQDIPVYLGQSKKLLARINTHAKADRFANCLISYHSMPEALDHQLLEREVDLIGACYGANYEPPKWQYRPL